MEQGIIKKNDVKKIISALRKNYIVYGPVKRSEGIIFTELTPDKEIIFDYHNSKLSPKGLFFPQCEVIGTFDDKTLHEVTPLKNEFVVFGMRPCDARSLQLLDRVFDSVDIKDPYYLHKRENAIIVTVACNDPQDTCFCTAFGGSPAEKEGSDILVFDMGDSLLFEVCTNKGKSCIEKFSNIFRKVEKADLIERNQQKTIAEKKVPVMNYTGLEEKLSINIDLAVWESIAQRCLSCGVCTFLCPTCHCFALFDEGIGSEEMRMKVWDSCQYPSFTLEASGHNPHGSNSERMKQRIMHKYNYFVQNFGETACVGCGRCVSYCPVNIDIREIMSDIVLYENKDS